MKVYPEYSQTLKDREIIHKYIHGGRGVVELVAPSGKKHTYAFLKPKDPTTFPDDVIFVYAFHNYEKLFYIGMIEEDVFRQTRHSRFLPDTEIVKGARYINQMANIENFAISSPMTLNHLGMCARCGRALTDEKWLKLGVGKKCMKYINEKEMWGHGLETR